MQGRPGERRRPGRRAVAAAVVSRRADRRERVGRVAAADRIDGLARRKRSAERGRVRRRRGEGVAFDAPRPSRDARQVARERPRVARPLERARVHLLARGAQPLEVGGGVARAHGGEDRRLEVHDRRRARELGGGADGEAGGGIDAAAAAAGTPFTGWRQPFRLMPGPPNFGLSRQCAHLPQSAAPPPPPPPTAATGFPAGKSFASSVCSIAADVSSSTIWRAGASAADAASSSWIARITCATRAGCSGEYSGVTCFAHCACVMHSVGRPVATRGRLAGGASAATSAVRPVRPGGGGSGAAARRRRAAGRMGTRAAARSAASAAAGGSAAACDKLVELRLVQVAHTDGSPVRMGRRRALLGAGASATTSPTAPTAARSRRCGRPTDGPSDDCKVSSAPSTTTVDLAGDRRVASKISSSACAETCWA